MITKPGSNIYGRFSTYDTSTKVLTNANQLPTIAVYRNGAIDAAFVVTIVNVGTGLYAYSGVIPAGYVAGDHLQGELSATVGAASGKKIIFELGIDTSFLSEVAAPGDAMTLTAAYDAAKTAAAPGDEMAISQAAQASIAQTVVDAIADANSGLYTVTINTVDNSAQPIPGAQVAILNEASQTVRTVITNSSGTVQTTLDAGSYSTRAFKAMVNFVDIEFQVAAPSTVNITGAALSPAQPVNGCQTLWVIPENPSLMLDTTCQIVAEAVVPNQFVGTALLTSSRIVATRADGHFVLTLAKGGRFNVTGRARDTVFLRKSITVTNDDIRELREYA